MIKERGSKSRLISLVVANVSVFIIRGLIKRNIVYNGEFLRQKMISFDTRRRSLRDDNLFRMAKPANCRSCNGSQTVNRGINFLAMSLFAGLATERGSRCFLFFSSHSAASLSKACDKWIGRNPNAHCFALTTISLTRCVMGRQNTWRSRRL